MQILIDGDGCPVIRQTVSIAKRYGIGCVIICDTAHFFDIDGVSTVTVDKGADSADFKLANMIKPDDIAVTQDYGLAAMCLARGARVLDQNGREFGDDNISAMLEARAAAKKLRRAGKRLKGPKKRSADDDRRFEQALEAIIKALSVK